MTVVRTYETVIGPVSLTEESGILVSLSFSTQITRGPESDLLRRASQELYAWLAGDLERFTVPYQAKGTVFMLDVWREILSVNRGSVITYGKIAQDLGNPRAARAVGGACHRNPLPLVIPCHRVIGSSGALTGFAAPMALKRELLRREGVLI